VWGRGSVDMKGGVAVALHLAATLSAPRRDVTWVFYDNEEVVGERNGLGRALAARPDWFEADLAVLGEPTGAGIEGGCNGTLRLILHVPGTAAHSARAWRGVNAIHAAATLIERVKAAPVRTVEVEGLAFRESFSVVLIEGGTAANTIPDHCRVTVNYRFAPDLDGPAALARARRARLANSPSAASVWWPMPRRGVVAARMKAGSSSSLIHRRNQAHKSLISARSKKLCPPETL